MAEGRSSDAKFERQLLIRGGRVYDHDDDIDDPAVRDICIEGSRIASVTAPDQDLELKHEIVRRAATSDDALVIEARGKLVIPGFVNSLYHSYDVLAKEAARRHAVRRLERCNSQPPVRSAQQAGDPRPRAARRSSNACAAAHPTLQDMNSLVAWDEETLDHESSSAYAEIGIRVVFSIAVRDVAALDIAPFLPPDVPEAAMAIIRGAPKVAREEIDFVERQLQRLAPLPPRLSWGLSPSGPQRSSRALLEGIADLAQRYELPIFTHVYETKAQTAKARAIYGDHGGSMIRHLAEIGLLTPRTTIAHGVQAHRDEDDDPLAGAEKAASRNKSISRYEAEERRRADACGDAGRCQGGARLRQLQLRRLPEHVSGHEDVLLARSGHRPKSDRRARGGCNQGRDTGRGARDESRRRDRRDPSRHESRSSSRQLISTTSPINRFQTASLRQLRLQAKPAAVAAGASTIVDGQIVDVSSAGSPRSTRRRSGTNSPL